MRAQPGSHLGDGDPRPGARNAVDRDLAAHDCCTERALANPHNAGGRADRDVAGRGIVARCRLLHAAEDAQDLERAPGTKTPARTLL